MPLREPPPRPEDGDAVGYHYRVRGGRWLHHWATGRDLDECDVKTIVWLSTTPGGGPDAIIRLFDQVQIWQGIDWPKVLQACELRNVTSHIDRVTLYRSQLSQYGPHYTELVSAPLIAN